MVWDAVAIGDECGPERRRVGWSGSGKEGGKAGRLNGKNKGAREREAEGERERE